MTIYRISSLATPQNRFKVHVNATVGALLNRSRFTLLASLRVGMDASLDRFSVAPLNVFGAVLDFFCSCKILLLEAMRFIAELRFRTFMCTSR